MQIDVLTIWPVEISTCAHTPASSLVGSGAPAPGVEPVVAVFTGEGLGVGVGLGAPSPYAVPVHRGCAVPIQQT